MNEPSEADIADARAMWWCVERDITTGYLIHISGYSRQRVSRLVALGRALAETNSSLASSPKRILKGRIQ